MKILELNPIKNKTVFLYLMELKHNKWSMEESIKTKKLLETLNFDFISIDSTCEDSSKNFDSSLIKTLRKCTKPYFFMDIPEYAKGYLFDKISVYKEQIEEIQYELKLNSKKQEQKNLNRVSKLKSWLDYLNDEVQDQEKNLNIEIRSQWIVKGLLDLINMYEVNSLIIIHLTPEEMLPRLKNLLETLNINVLTSDVQIKDLFANQVIGKETNSHNS